MKKILIACCLVLSLLVFPLESFAEENTEKCTLCGAIFHTYNSRGQVLYVNYLEIRKDNENGEIVWLQGNKSHSGEAFEIERCIPLSIGTYHVRIEQDIFDFAPLCAPRVYVNYCCKIINISQEDVDNSINGVQKAMIMNLDKCYIQFI